MSRGRAKALPVRVIQNVEHLGSTPVDVAIRLDQSLASELAEYLDVEALENFQAELHLRRWGAHGVAVTGEVSADIVQECVVSLAPVCSHVKEIISARFLPETELEMEAEAPSAPSGEIWVDPAEDDPPEGFNGREIDLGAVAVEFLALGINPYPRAEGANLNQSEDLSPDRGESLPPSGEEQAPNAFRVLAALRDRLKK